MGVREKVSASCSSAAFCSAVRQAEKILKAPCQWVDIGVCAAFRVTGKDCLTEIRKEAIRGSPHRIAETGIVRIEGFQQKKRFINFHLLKGLKSRHVIPLSVLRAWTVPRPGGGANNRKRQRRWSARSGHPEGPRALPANFQTAAPCRKAAKERSGRRTPSGRE